LIRFLIDADNFHLNYI